tara:strand:+ start:1311 stop:1481 length:171 start_codon:yes stop_codon:yes gene_type:complete
MSSNQEDTMWRIYMEVEEKKLRKKFDKQIKKMETQEKHKYKEVCEMWEYALAKIKE